MTKVIQMTKDILIIAFATLLACCLLCGCKFALKDASAAIGELMCETPKN